MCLILVGVDARPGSRVMLLANRDEQHARASAAAAPWEEDVRVLGGRDLVAGGSWLAVRGDGRFAAVTNLRDLHNGPPPSAPRSRGELVRDFVCGEQSAERWLDALLTRIDLYAPFNLIVGDAEGVRVLDGSTGEHHRLAPGLHAISNGPIHEDWPKMQRIRALANDALGQGADPSTLLVLLGDEQQAQDDRLPNTGLERERERLLSSIFIRGTGYGTRASTWLDIGKDGSIDLHEASFGPDGVRGGVVRWRHVPDAGWSATGG
ncbi:MAG: NRDE family protein [Lysobacteraceae bacterium]